MKMKLKRVGPLQAGKILGVLYGAASLLIVPVFALLSATAAMSGGKQSAFPVMFGLGMIIIAPILYSLMGFVAGVIGAWLYNLIAGWIGGFELEFESERAREIWPNVPPAPPAH